MARKNQSFNKKTNFYSPPPPRAGGAGQIPKPPSNLPPYLIVPALTLTGGIIYGYYHFQDEVPYTKRKRLLLTSPQHELTMGHNQYKQLTQFHKKDILPSHHRASVTVHRVGSRLASSTKTFMKQYHSSSSADADFYNKPFTYTIIQSDQVNAFVLPGNHIFVYTGLFQYIQNEDELAAVLGHEMAHVLARHGGERLSGNVLMTLFGRLLWWIDPSLLLYSIFVPAVKVLRELPHSREHEVEADHIGLVLASEACFDPRAAKRVFGSMKEGKKIPQDGNKANTTSQQQQQQPPEFLSTHPSYDSRLTNFDNWMSEAMSIYNANGGMRCQRIRREMAEARKIASAEHMRREEELARRRRHRG
uniref:Peptidase M48 domain-containing protein n=1 Tax=Ditylum brightwellii TaxID=49249 RepID=A0A7S1YW04_9STRA|mmetsp:Transcript_18823/g.28090  ORF Transcript_18823/g.28090 Transcript_18823/m.28090 type:complete len:361 (+) Transcript_18823:172-1254(+)